MPTLTQSSPLAANLAALGERNADVRAAIEAAPASAAVHFETSRSGPLTATLDGAALASRHDPQGEASRLADTVDLTENAVVVTLGFGLGYHVEQLGRRLKRAGLIVVYEPDVALLRAALERIDHSAWLRETIVMFVTSADDRGALGRKLAGTEAFLAQGVVFLEHPPSRRRLGRGSATLSATFSGYVTTAKTTFVTTIVRSVDTVRNLLANVDHYACGPGIADLRDAAAGRLAVVVSAGPSLRRNLHRLAEPGVRDRCVIIAVQTTLKPLLRAGIRPHFVTALDYHEISRRFYEGLAPSDGDGTTLVVEPKAHPAILDAFPGPVRCCASPFLDRLLDDPERDMGLLPAGATVAHLAVYLARWLGCDPVAMIGQDLGFPDGLYYAPGTAIHDVWSPELNPFNTIAMMEWQRIVRYRVHLHKTVDVFGKSIYTDTQMRTYLQQFERDFAGYAEAGLEIIDATEGGVAKQHVRPMPLADVLARYATTPLPPLPAPAPPDESRRPAAATRLDDVHREIAEIRATSGRTAKLLRRMLRDQTDAGRMTRHFEKVERERALIETRQDSFKLLECLNQLGTFKRLRADRRLHLQTGLGELARQRAQLERDLENVQWIAEAADEMGVMLDTGRQVLRGVPADPRSRPRPDGRGSPAAPRPRSSAAGRVAALVPVDPIRNGRGIARSLAEPWGDAPVLQRTLERLGTCAELETIVLLVPETFDVEPLLDRSRIGRPVEIETVPDSPFGPERPAITAARAWADTSWRGGIGGMTVYDEAVCPGPMAAIMTRRKLAAAVVAAPDWPLVDTSTATGVPALVRRWREHPEHHTIVFTQAPPGLSACLLTRPVMTELAQRTRISSVGGLLGYQPHAPQDDPIGRDGNVQIDHAVRHALVRGTFDDPRQHARLRRALDAGAVPDAATVVAALERDAAGPSEALPPHLILELTPERRSTGVFGRHPCGPITRPPMDPDLAARLFEAAGRVAGTVVTLAGVGDPLLHPDFDGIIARARAAGIHAVHVRTELLVERPVVDRLLANAPDVVSVDLHADCAATYERMMGVDRFGQVLEHIQHLARHRRVLTGAPAGTGFAVPWIVPRLERRVETYEDLDSFFDRWQHVLGAAVIESPPDFPRSADWTPDTLAEAVTPRRVVEGQLARRLTIYSDGTVPVSEFDLAGRHAAGSVAHEPLDVVWARLREARTGDDAPTPGIFRP